MKWHLNAKLSHEEYLQLAKYLAYQDQLVNAITLLLQLDRRDALNKDLLFYLLQIGIYDKLLIPEAKYVELMKKAQEQYRRMNFVLYLAKERWEFNH